MPISCEKLGDLYSAVFGLKRGKAASVFSLEESFFIASAVLEILATLSPREEKVIKMRFGLTFTGRTYTMEEVGQHFALTRQRISQIEAKALRKLRHPSRQRALQRPFEILKEPSEATTLELPGLAITELPEFLAKFSNIRQLTLRANQIETLPEFISQWTKLEEIDLSQNKLTVLPNSFDELLQLTKLDLS